MNSRMSTPDEKVARWSGEPPPRKTATESELINMLRTAKQEAIQIKERAEEEATEIRERAEKDAVGCLLFTPVHHCYDERNASDLPCM